MGLTEREKVGISINGQLFVFESEAPAQRGRPQACCDGLPDKLLALESVYRRPLRALQGLLALPALPLPKLQPAQQQDGAHASEIRAGCLKRGANLIIAEGV